MAGPSYKFAGFISYSQKDKGWARRIHKALETYRLPVGLAGTAEAGSRKLGRFFRDDDELAGAPSLGAALTGALDDSQTLIVICSPNAAQSKWVDAEIRHFKSRGPEARVLAVIVGGKPDSDDPSVMCFPPSMLRTVDADGNLTDEPDEPLAPDAQKEKLDRLTARLVAGVIGVEFDALWQREVRRKRRRQLVAGVVGLLLAGAATIGYLAYDDAEQQRLAQESINLAIEAQAAMDDARVDDALKLVLSALPEDIASADRPVVPEAVAALRRIMAGNPSAGVLAQFDQPVTDLHVIDGNRLAVGLGDGSYNVLDRGSGAVLHIVSSDDFLQRVPDSHLIYSSFSDERLLEGQLQIVHRVNVFDLRTGMKVRGLVHEDSTKWLGPAAAISSDGSRVLVQSSNSAPETERGYLYIWEIPESGAAPTPKEIAQVASPLPDGEGLFKAAFSSTETIALFRFDGQGSTGIWNFASGVARKLSAPNVETTCGLPRKDKGRDSLALSSNGRIISHAAPLDGEGWCVAMWDARTGASLPHLEVDQGGIGAVDALDPDRLALVRNGTAFLARSGLWSRVREELHEVNCGGPRVDTHSVRVRQIDWLISADGSVSICTSGSQIEFNSGSEMDMSATLHGHSQGVQAIAPDRSGERLFSAGADGTVRLWDLGRLPGLMDLSGRVFSLKGWRGKIAALHEGEDGEVVATLLDGRSGQAEPAIPFPIAGYKMDPPPRGRLQIAAFPMAEDRMLLVESWDCGFFGCPPEVPRRAVLFDSRTGGIIAELDNLAGGRFLAGLSAALAFDPDRSRIAAVRRDGSAFHVEVAGGLKTEVALPEGFLARQPVIIAGDVWLRGHDGAEEPQDRFVSMVRVDTAYTAAEVSRDRAQGGVIHTSSSGEVGLLFLDVIHGPEARPEYRVLSRKGASSPFTMPFERQVGESLRHASFFDADRQVALFFMDEGAPPQRIELNEDPVQTPEKISTLVSNLPVSMLDTWRVDDPAGRVVISVADDRFFMQPLIEGTSVCPDLIGSRADAALFSNDGNLLVVSDSSLNRTNVYEVEGCNLVQQSNLSVAHNNGRMLMVDSHIWSLSDAGDLRRMGIEADIIDLHVRARELANSLGGEGN
jgi:hypothetical protein